MTDNQEMELTYTIIDLIRLSQSLYRNKQMELSTKIEDVAKELIDYQAELNYETK